LATGGQATQALEAIVLAAGAGLRFGGGKLLAPYGDGVLLDAALASAFAAPVRSVTVVTGAQADAVARAARALAARLGQSGRLAVVHAAEHAEGMGASLRTGVAALPADTEGVFVFLGDMPRIPAWAAPALARALAQGAAAAVPTFRGQRGHPALIGRALFPALLALKADTGARAVLQGLGDALASVEAPDDGVLFDVDRPQDLAPTEAG